jgi:hypothetical protein
VDSYSFYKSLYDRELNRRKDLDTSIGLPITILTVIVASNTYILKGQKIIQFEELLQVKYIIIFLTFIALFISVFYIMKSSNNLFKGFAYKNFALLKDIRVFEEDINTYNSQVDESKAIDFQQKVIEKLIVFADSHIIFNDRRSIDLYNARLFLIISFILTGINFIILTLNYIKL